MTQAVAKPVPRWAIHRRLYDWTLSLAHHKHAEKALFGLSFAESSFFPIPPDVLQIALSIERPRRSWHYALINTIGSVLGGVFGWVIGWGLWSVVSGFFFRFVPGVTEENFELVREKFEDNATLAIFAAAFTPIPYKVFTIASGVFGVNVWILAGASVVGRGLRFFLVAAVCAFLGPAAKRFIDRYFNILTIAFTVLLVAGFLVIKVFAASKE
ncbi:MAG: DedA family protein [Phycisphaeraceae bacterium]|nr:DedA family protein [Phycisphaeraceae bacterium]